MQRFALPAVVVVAAGLLAPAASAAMSDEYSPHFDPAPRHAAVKPGDGYSETVEYELLGVPEGTKWKQTGEDTLRKKAQLFNGETEFVDKPLGVRLNNYTRETPPQPGENVIDFSVRVLFPDGSNELYSQKVTLTSDDAFYYNPLYDARVTANPGQTVTLTPENQYQLDLPTNARWKVTGGEGWDWSVDQKTGTITATVPTDSYSDANFEGSLSSRMGRSARLGPASTTLVSVWSCRSPRRRSRIRTRRRRAERAALTGRPRRRRPLSSSASWRCW